jgi:hypothetical protein
MAKPCLRIQQKDKQIPLFATFYLWRHSSTRTYGATFSRFLHHIQTHHTGSTPLDEWSAHRRHRYLRNTQQPQETNIRALSGIRTRNPRNRAALDPHLTPRGHRDRLATHVWIRTLMFDVHGRQRHLFRRRRRTQRDVADAQCWSGGRWNAVRTETYPHREFPLGRS